MNIRTWLKNNFSDHNRERWRNWILKGKTMHATNDLKLMFDQYGTDKGTHGFSPIYQYYFSSIRCQIKVLLEIGIGGTHNPKSGGGSLKVWARYFPNAMILGLDMFDKSFFDSRTIKTFRGNQSNRNDLNAITSLYPNIDIIIDDGSHLHSDVIASFDYLFPYITSGGYYVIEDMVSSFDTVNNHQISEETIRYFNRLLTMIYLDTSNSDNESNLVAMISAIHIHNNILFIKKK